MPDTPILGRAFWPKDILLAMFDQAREYGEATAHLPSHDEAMRFRYALVNLRRGDPALRAFATAVSGCEVMVTRAPEAPAITITAGTGGSEGAAQ